MTRQHHAPLRLGFWTLPLVGVVVFVNVAGVWEIAAALRNLREHGERTLKLETAARARTVESVLSQTTADLAFLVGSASLGFDPAASGGKWRNDVGAALLLFLRGHPQVKNLVVAGADGTALVVAGRPRGVPGFWIPGPAAPSLDVAGVALRREFAISASAVLADAPAQLEALVDPGSLLGGKKIGEDAVGVACMLLDATGARLADEAFIGEDSPSAAAAVAAADWGVPEPFLLRCAPAEATAAAELEPLVARHRMTILLNLVVMASAALLGVFALHQSRRRQQLEARAREEKRVRELERQLFHAERLSTAGRLAAGMAHEINNPLEGMSNYLRLAGDALERSEAEVARRYLAGVRQGLERAAGIVRRVLDHADPSVALQDEVDLGNIVSAAVEFVRSRDEFAAIRFETHLPPQPAKVRGSAVMLGQVFLNLVLNACEAQPAGGEVVVRCRRNGHSVEAEVGDRGPGVPKARRGRIFEPFETTKQSAGLGLSICHSIVQRHGGELSLHDRDGGGSVFRVRMKLLPEGGGSGGTA